MFMVDSKESVYSTDKKKYHFSLFDAYVDVSNDFNTLRYCWWTPFRNA